MQTGIPKNWSAGPDKSLIDNVLLQYIDRHFAYISLLPNGTVL
jgi:hypothetical protein